MRSRPFNALHGVIVVGVLVVALIMGVLRLLPNKAAPTSDVPAVAWEEQGRGDIHDAQIDVQDETDIQGIAIGEPTPGTTPPPTPPAEDTPSDSVSSPSSYNLALPFTSQAPTGNWDAVHEETCEEASVYMVTQYFAGVPSGTLGATTTDAALLSLVAYEEKNGYGVSVSAAELQTIITEYYAGAYTVDVIENPSADDIKSVIADGYPVIIPAAGRMLGNPFFTGEGPLYHMLVVRGYEDGRFVTNDPGTRHGENYTYSETVLMNAVHDWNNGDPTNGARRVLVMKPVK